ncbi:MAG: hypothetical protein KAH77_01905 [Thiomargarita sp.]|nr:hypothetical protein [Thiomargarita sp.]
MNKILYFVIYFVILSVIGSGCSGMLPSTTVTTKSPWKYFEDAKRDFDKIIPHETNSEDLKRLGFDPFEIPNVKLITYLDLLKIFLPNDSIKLEHLEPGVRSCLEMRDGCYGYEVAPQILSGKRYGSVALDLLNFQKKKITTGWKFKALIVLNNGLVVHKVWGGEPNISKIEIEKNPLGPLQNIDKLMPSISLF